MLFLAHLALFVRCPSVNISHFNLLLRNHWANWNQTLVEWFFLFCVIVLQSIKFEFFRGEDLNVIFYQNMPNLHNRYISAERKISQKNPEYTQNKKKGGNSNLIDCNAIAQNIKGR
jgi:hypothetical protein